MTVIRAIDQQILARVRKVRNVNQLTQTQFAQKLGLTLDQVASMEYARTPLTIRVADEISTQFDVSLIWLAEGIGRMNPTTGLIRNIASEIKENSLLSTVWNRELRERLRKSYLYSLFVMDAILTGNAGLPAGHERQLLDEFLRETEEVFSGLDHDGKARLLNALIRALPTATLQEELKREGALANASADVAKTKFLHGVDASVIIPNVKPQWPLLKKRLRKAAHDIRKKIKLADFVGVKLASVNQWLRESDEAREPGAETALRMLKWVELQERK